MKTLTCVIVDDEPLAVQLLESFVNKTPQLSLVASFTDSVEAMQHLTAEPVDLLFLDIQMPDVNGMELAHQLPSETFIIFTTAFREFAFESYEVNTVDFLLKPIRYTKFLNAVEKVMARCEERVIVSAEPTNPENHKSQSSNLNPAESTFLRVDGELKRVDFSQILYVEGMKDYVMFYLDDERRPLITHLTMKAVEQMLPTDRFMRVNRSYIVALSKIRTIDRNLCLYIGNEIIRVTDMYKETFNNYLNRQLPG